MEVANKSVRTYLGDGQWVTDANCPKCGKEIYTYSHKFPMFEACPTCNTTLEWGSKITKESLEIKEI